MSPADRDNLKAVPPVSLRLALLMGLNNDLVKQGTEQAPSPWCDLPKLYNTRKELLSSDDLSEQQEWHYEVKDRM